MILCCRNWDGKIETKHRGDLETEKMSNEITPENNTDKFITTLPVVNAIDAPLRLLGIAIGGAVLSAVLWWAAVAGIAWLHETLTGSATIFAKIGSVLIYIFIVILAILMLLAFIGLWQDYGYYRKLQKQGITTQAKIVGKEMSESEEGPGLMYIFYQFQPDFVVKYQDTTKNARFYKQAEGAEITVRYLAENPQVTVVVL
jgi:hypothetical protein